MSKGRKVLFEGEGFKFLGTLTPVDEEPPPEPEPPAEDGPTAPTVTGDWVIGEN